MLAFQSAGVCNELPTKWENKLETTTQFPVDPATVVEVTCSDPEARNITGSFQVTCYSDRIFTYKSEPRCTGIKHDTKTLQNTQLLYFTLSNFT